MVITRPMGSGQRPHPPSSNRSNGRRIGDPARARGVRARRRGGPAPGGAAAAAAVLATPPAGPGVDAGPLPAAGTHRRGRHGGDLHRRPPTAPRASCAPSSSSGCTRTWRAAATPSTSSSTRAAAVRPRALEHRARVRLRARRRGVLPGARVHPRPRPGTAGAAARRGVRAIAECPGRLLHHARGDGGARLRARQDRPRRPQRWRSSTATSRRATSWCRRAAR